MEKEIKVTKEEKKNKSKTIEIKRI